jgi:hypothetical protein
MLHVEGDGIERLASENAADPRLRDPAPCGENGTTRFQAVSKDLKARHGMLPAPASAGD